MFTTAPFDTIADAIKRSGLTLATSKPQRINGKTGTRFRLSAFFRTDALIRTDGKRTAWINAAAERRFLTILFTLDPNTFVATTKATYINQSDFLSKT